MAGSNNTRNLVTSALFMMFLSQELTFSPSHTAFTAAHPRGVSSPSLSQFPGFTREMGMWRWCTVLRCSLVHINVGSSMLILVSHGSVHM